MTSEAERIFVAGAGGAIGRRLCPLLVRDGWKVMGTTRYRDKASALRSMGVAPAIIDVFDERALAGTVRRARRNAGSRLWASA